MAKSEKAISPEMAQLKKATEAYERGDVVTARTLAQNILKTALPADGESKELEAMAGRLSSTEAKVDATLHGIAANLISRTQVPKRVYFFALAAALAWLTLVALAASRY